MPAHVNVKDEQAASASPCVYIHAGFHIDADVGDLARFALAETVLVTIDVRIDDAAVCDALGTEVSLG